MTILVEQEVDNLCAEAEDAEADLVAEGEGQVTAEALRPFAQTLYTYLSYLPASLADAGGSYIVEDAAKVKVALFAERWLPRYMLLAVAGDSPDPEGLAAECMKAIMRVVEQYAHQEDSLQGPDLDALSRLLALLARAWPLARLLPKSGDVAFFRGCLHGISGLIFSQAASEGVPESGSLDRRVLSLQGDAGALELIESVRRITGATPVGAAVASGTPDAPATPAAVSGAALGTIPGSAGFLSSLLCCLGAFLSPAGGASSYVKLQVLRYYNRVYLSRHARPSQHNVRQIAFRREAFLALLEAADRAVATRLIVGFTRQVMEHLHAVQTGKGMLLFADRRVGGKRGGSRAGGEAEAGGKGSKSVKSSKHAQGGEKHRDLLQWPLICGLEAHLDAVARLRVADCYYPLVELVLYYLRLLHGNIRFAPVKLRLLDAVCRFTRATAAGAGELSGKAVGGAQAFSAQERVFVPILAPLFDLICICLQPVSAGSQANPAQWRAKILGGDSRGLISLAYLSAAPKELSKAPIYRISVLHEACRCACDFCASWCTDICFPEVVSRFRASLGLLVRAIDGERNPLSPLIAGLTMRDPQAKAGMALLKRLRKAVGSVCDEVTAARDKLDAQNLAAAWEGKDQSADKTALAHLAAASRALAGSQSERWILHKCSEDCPLHKLLEELNAQSPRDERLRTGSAEVAPEGEEDEELEEASGEVLERSEEGSAPERNGPPVLPSAPPAAPSVALPAARPKPAGKRIQVDADTPLGRLIGSVGQLSHAPEAGTFAADEVHEVRF